jgi:hypothetical protein
MKPLEGDELGDAWSRSQAVIIRFHSYFRACKDAVGTELGCKPLPNRSSAQPTYIYQDFETELGELIGVGLSLSDYGLPLTPKVYRHAPIVWLTLEAYDWQDWPTRIKQLESNPPKDWRVNPDRWYGRPYVWRYLEDVVESGTFEQQQQRLATSCGKAIAWLEMARPSTSSRKLNGAGVIERSSVCLKRRTVSSRRRGPLKGPGIRTPEFLRSETPAHGG